MKSDDVSRKQWCETATDASAVSDQRNTSGESQTSAMFCRSAHRLPRIICQSGEDSGGLSSLLHHCGLHEEYRHLILPIPDYPLAWTLLSASQECSTLLQSLTVFVVEDTKHLCCSKNRPAILPGLAQHLTRTGVRLNGAQPELVDPLAKWFRLDLDSESCVMNRQPCERFMNRYEIKFGFNVALIPIIRNTLRGWLGEKS